MNIILIILIGAILVGLVVVQLITMSRIQKRIEIGEERSSQALTKTVDLVLEQLGRTQASGERGSMAMHQRLDHANQTVAAVQQALSRLEEKTGQVAQLSGEIASLQRILQAPKMRGSLGEIWLAELIAQIIPKERYKLQYRFNDGEICDAVIILRDDHILPIDAKFSMENFVKAQDQENPAEKQRYLKAFASDTKKRIDEIAKKYIRADQGTLDFAFMYVPAENIYYHAFIHDESDSNLLGYAFSKRVIPVSPSSFFAHLQVVLFGLRGMEIEQSAKEIQKSLTLLTGEFEKIRDTYDKLGTHLKNAQQSYDQTDKRLGGLENKVATLGSKQLPVEAIEISE